MGGMQQDIIKVYVKFPEAVQLLAADLVMTAGRGREVRTGGRDWWRHKFLSCLISIEICTVFVSLCIVQVKSGYSQTHIRSLCRCLGMQINSSVTM